MTWDGRLDSRIAAAVVAIQAFKGVEFGMGFGVAKLAGSPQDKGAGLFIPVVRGQSVAAGEPLLTLYAESAGKLEHAWNYMQSFPLPVEIV